MSDSSIVEPGGSSYRLPTPVTSSVGEIPQMSMERMLPRQLSTGSLRGTQTVGYGNVKIDGSSNRITLSANNTNITIGDTSDTDDTTGIGLTDSKGNNIVLLGSTPGTTPTNGLTVFDKSNTRRLLAGTFPNGDIKIKLSQAGYDVATATDDQLIWSSDFPLFKIVKHGIITLNGAGPVSTNTVTLTLPNYGTVPNYLAFLRTGINYGDILPAFNLVSIATAGGVAAIPTIVYATAYQTLNDGKIDFNASNFQTGVGDVNVYSIEYYVLKETTQTL